MPRRQPALADDELARVGAGQLPITSAGGLRLHAHHPVAPARAAGQRTRAGLRGIHPHQAAQDRRGRRAQHPPRAPAAGLQSPPQARVPQRRPRPGSLSDQECCPRHVDELLLLPPVARSVNLPSVSSLHPRTGDLDPLLPFRFETICRPTLEISGGGTPCA